MDSLTSFCSVILSHRSSSEQKVSSPKDQIEKSFEVLPDGHIKSNGGVENYQKQLQGQVRTMVAAMQERTRYRPTADSALMIWIARHAALLIPRFRDSDVQSPQYRGKLVEFGETVLAHLPEVGKGSGNPAPKLVDRWTSGVWLEKERPYRRTPCPNGRRSCKCAKCTTTRRKQLVG